MIPGNLYPLVLVQLSKKFCVLMGNVVVHFKVAFHTFFWSFFDYLNFWNTVPQFGNNGANPSLFPWDMVYFKDIAGFYGYACRLFHDGYQVGEQVFLRLFHPSYKLDVVFLRVLHILVCLSVCCHGWILDIVILLAAREISPSGHSYPYSSRRLFLSCATRIFWILYLSLW